MKRLCINSAEIAIILGKSQSNAQKLVRIIKDVHKKKSHQPITIREFCEYMDLPYQDVFDMINSVKPSVSCENTLKSVPSNTLKSA